MTRASPAAPIPTPPASCPVWLTGGILRPDPDPALYAYCRSATADKDTIERGLIGALRRQPYAARIVQPHEDVARGLVAGWWQLMEATQANLEPIFLLYQGGNGVATKLVDEVADGRLPLA